MKALVACFVIAATLFFGGVFLYEHAPTHHSRAVPGGVRVVEELWPRKVLKTITKDGKPFDMEIMVNDTIKREVRETASRTVTAEPNWMDGLRFWVVVAALVGLGVYAIAVFGLWLRDKIKQRPDSKDTEDTKRRFDEMIRLCAAVLVTLLTTGGLNPHITDTPVAAISKSQPGDMTVPGPETDSSVPSYAPPPLPAETPSEPAKPEGKSSSAPKNQREP
jgi:hypothetical protein